MHRLSLLAVIVLLLLPAATQAQNSTSVHQHMSASPMIDGAVHPELIPDSIAYSLYFTAVSVPPNATDEDRKRQSAQLNRIGLPDIDREVLVAVLVDFRAKHEVIATQYNQAAEAALARNEAPDTASLVKQVNDLVNATRDALKSHMSPQAVTQLHAFVQSEKKYMRVNVESQ